MFYVPKDYDVLLDVLVCMYFEALKKIAPLRVNTVITFPQDRTRPSTTDYTA